MARWLFKEEPSAYSYDCLVRDGETLWEGVTNALARKHLRNVNVGDEVLFYHTGDEKAVIGVMRVSSGPEQDPQSEDEKSVVVGVKPKQRLPKPVPLSVIKADDSLANWELVRMPRLSVMPVSDEQWAKIEALSRT